MCLEQFNFRNQTSLAYVHAEKDFVLNKPFNLKHRHIIYNYDVTFIGDADILTTENNVCPKSRAIGL